jgi:hypothetical protein
VLAFLVLEAQTTFTLFVVVVCFKPVVCFEPVVVVVVVVVVWYVIALLSRSLCSGVLVVQTNSTIS